MKNIFYKLILFFAFTSCGILTSQKKTVCNCCDKTYTNIDSALTCGADPENYKLFLFALVSSDIQASQKLGWNILKEQEIINVAKRDYVLIVIDPNKIDLSKENNSKEFLDIIKQHKNETYFVVTNRAFYPFREFSLQTDKDKIINDLSLGDGP